MFYPSNFHQTIAETWEDHEVNDWGKVKQTVTIFKGTLLMKAIWHHDFKAVHALLSSGLADPMLQMSSDYYIDHHHTMPKTPKKDAMIVAKTVESEIMANHTKHANDLKVYIKTDVKNTPRRKQRELFAALVNVALSMWPNAPYHSPEAGYLGDKRSKFTHRMHGVTNSESQTKAMEILNQKLVIAIESCLLEPVDEGAIASLIESNNGHHHVESCREK